MNGIFLNSMPNSWSKQAYVQGFYCESITFKKAVNMFEHMEIVESIYEGIVEPSYKIYEGRCHLCSSQQEKDRRIRLVTFLLCDE